MALSIFFAAFLICSLLVFFLSVYGAKEVTFEENLKATGQQTGKSQKKSSKLDTKKKNQAKKLAAKGPADTSEIVSEIYIFSSGFTLFFLVKLPYEAQICDLLDKTLSRFDFGAGNYSFWFSLIW